MNGKNIHMTAICGMGMGSLAGYLKESGFNITGSDENVYPPMSELLSDIGIKIKKGYSKNNISKNTDIIIIGNAVTKNNPEAMAAEQSGIPTYSMPEFLEKMIIPGKKSLVVSGTHGKTTTTSLLGWVLGSAGEDPSVIVGGRVNSWNKSYKVGGGKYFVIEGDEYDSAYFDKVPKFLHYIPENVILTGIEFDHCDIYSSIEKIKEEFRKLIDLIPESGSIVAYGESQYLIDVIANSKKRIVKYGFSEGFDFYAKDIVNKKGKTVFSIYKNTKKTIEIESPMIGRQNILNALSVFSLLRDLEISSDLIKKGIETFPGVKRRQEVVADISGVKIVDDFAHHPTAVALTIEGFRFSYPDSKLWAVFEPRTNTSRRKYFEKDFPKSFVKADKVIIAKVHNAEALQEDEILDVNAVVEGINKSGGDAKYIEEVYEIVAKLSQEVGEGDVVLIMSNGAFGGIHKKLAKALETRG